MAYLLQYLGDLQGDDCDRALGLLAEANALTLGGLGQYTLAVDRYDRAAALYDQHEQVAEKAGAVVGKVFALAMLGQYEEALETGAQARPVLEQNQQWRALAYLSMNLAVVHGRRRDDERALVEFDKTRALCLRIGADGQRLLPLVEQDRAIVLRNLGRFQASIKANETALRLLEQTNQKAEIGHVQHNLAATYVMLGRFNEALALLDRARDTFLADGRPVDAIEADLVTSHCLLQLRRFDDALEKCRDVRNLCAEIGRQREVAEALLNEAVAHTGLHRFDLAIAALNDARERFRAEDNQVLVNRVDSERAALLGLQGQHRASLTLAVQCAGEFERRNLPVQQAQASLVAARAAVALDDHSTARQLAEQALATAERKRLAELAHQAHAILAADAETQDNRQEARQHYELAIQALERPRGRAMVEFPPATWRTNRRSTSMRYASAWS
ncbi:MAG: tetratricopeptide repeat protein [Caldilineales bacterium]